MSASDAKSIWEKSDILSDLLGDSHRYQLVIREGKNAGRSVASMFDGDVQLVPTASDVTADAKSTATRKNAAKSTPRKPRAARKAA